MSLFADYYIERAGSQVIEWDKGFIIFRFCGEECFLQEIYVIPEERMKSYSRYLIDDMSVMARKAGCKYIAANISPEAGGSSHAMLAALRLGFTLVRSGPNSIIIKKEL